MSKRKRIERKRKLNTASIMAHGALIFIGGLVVGFYAGNYYGNAETLKECAEEVYIKHGGNEYQCRPIKKVMLINRKDQ